MMMKLTCILVAFAIAGVCADEPEMMVNGQPTNINEYPHCISMRMNGNHMCGGSLISNRHVLTAAHCLVPIQGILSRVKVVNGATYLNSGGETRGIARVTIHPNYDQSNQGRTNYDIGIITLDAPIQSNIARPVKLPSRELVHGESVTVVAWGSRGFRQPIHNDLQKLTATCMAPNLCQQYLRNVMPVYANEFCMFVGQGTGTCNGDSGSGVVDASRTTIVGLVSGGIPCARGYPDVFTSVRPYVSWIQQNICHLGYTFPIGAEVLSVIVYSREFILATCVPPAPRDTQVPCESGTTREAAGTTRVCLKIDFEWATRLNRLTLNAIGVWPRGDVRGWLLSDLRMWSSMILSVSMGVIPTLHSLMRTRDDMMATVDNLQFTLPLLTTMVKVIVVWWRRTDLALVLDMIADDWSRAKTATELRVMTKRARHARAITVFGYVLMALGFVLLAILPCFGKSLRYRTNVTDPGRLLPLQTYYLYDKDRSPYFELTFASQVLMILIIGTSYTGVDNLLGLLVFHLCGQMENLKERLIHVKPIGKSFDRGLAAVVQDHIRYFDIVEGIFTLLLLALLLCFGILFCLYGFLIVSMLTESRQMSMMRLVYLVSLVFNICSHMCLYCLVGDILVQQCKGLHQATYDYEWYTLEPERARTMILIMIRASKPLYITAGKMFPMTISMFCNLIKTSGGYVSVLLARQSL